MSTQLRTTRRLMAMLAAALFGLGLAAGGAQAQEFEVPEGFNDVFEPDASTTGEWRYLRTIRPVEGPFSHLSAIHLREVVGAVDDPADWLKARLTGNLGDMDRAAALLDSPDSPFGDPAFDALRKIIPELFKGITALAELPLSFCDAPHVGYNASGGFHELYCVYNVGPVRQYHVLRLQRVEDRWFYTEIETMNERRLRHLMVIANSFRLGG